MKKIAIILIGLLVNVAPFVVAYCIGGYDALKNLFISTVCAAIMIVLPSITIFYLIKSLRK